MLLASLLVMVPRSLVGRAFQRVGSPLDEGDEQRYLQCVPRISRHPLLITGVGLTLGGALRWIFGLDTVGAAGPALTGQRTIVLVALFSVVPAGDSAERGDLFGTFLPVTGIYPIQSIEELI